MTLSGFINSFYQLVTSIWFYQLVLSTRFIAICDAPVVAFALSPGGDRWVIFIHPAVRQEVMTESHRKPGAAVAVCRTRAASHLLCCRAKKKVPTYLLELQG